MFNNVARTLERTGNGRDLKKFCVCASAPISMSHRTVIKSCMATPLAMIQYQTMYLVGKAPGIPSPYKLVFIIVVIVQSKIVHLVQVDPNKMAAT